LTTLFASGIVMTRESEARKYMIVLININT